MGKKKQQNEFYFFMIEKKPEIEKRLGRSVKMDELPSLVYAEWTNMSEARKQKYKDMKEKTRETSEKLDCRGIPLNELKRREEENKRKIEAMKRDIGNTINLHQTGGALHHLKIYVISVSYYVCTDEGKYSPAELSVAQFCFEKGLMKEYHATFKPEIPLCYGFSAREHAQATHNLFDDELNPGIGIDNIVPNLKQFVKKENNRIPPLYTLDDQMECTEEILESIAGQGYFSVYSLDYFFQLMYSACRTEVSIPQSISTDILIHCGLDFHPEMACEWHRNNQPDSGKYCTQSCVRRWVYNMCDNVLLEKTFGITPIKGKHLPLAAPTYGVLVDIPKQSFKENRNTKAANLGNSGFSFAPSKLEPQGASAVSSPARSTNWSTPTSPMQSERLEPFRKPSQVNSWSKTVSSTLPAGTSRASSMASVCSSTIDASSEEDFPALGAGLARRDNTAVRGRGLYRNLGPSENRK